LQEEFGTKRSRDDEFCHATVWPALISMAAGSNTSNSPVMFTTGEPDAAEALAIAEEAFDCLHAPIAWVTAPDIPAIPASPPLERFYMPSVEKIVATLERTLEY